MEFAMGSPLTIESNVTCTEDNALKFCKEALRRYRGSLEETKQLNLLENSELGWLWASLVFYTLLCIIGVLGNLLTIIVFARFMKKTTTTEFITAVAVVDFLVCGTLLPISLYRQFHGISGSDGLCKMEKFIAFVTVPLSSGLLLAIALDRFFLVFVLHRDVVTRFRARLIIAVIAVLCAVTAIPQPLSFSTWTEILPPVVNIFCKGRLFCDSRVCLPIDSHVLSIARVKLWDFVLGMFAVMVTIFIIIYSLIFIKVYRINQKMRVYRSSNNTTIATECRRSSCDEVEPHQGNRRPSMASQTKQLAAEEIRLNLTSRDSSDSDPSATEDASLTNNVPTQVTDQKTPPRKRRMAHFQTALTLFLVTVTFVVAYTPMIVMRIFNVCSYQDVYGINYNTCTGNDYRNFLFNFFFLSHVANPFIYAILNPRFKEALKNGCGKCLARRFCGANS